MGTKVRKMIINRPKFKEVTYEDALRKTSARMDYDVVEPKMDGIWGAMHIKHGKYEIWSRTGKLKKEGRADESGQEMWIHGEIMKKQPREIRHWIQTINYSVLKSAIVSLSPRLEYLFE